MNETLNAILLIAVVAIVTFMTRLAPFALFGGKRKMPEIVRRLAGYLPAGIMAALVIYCIKDDVTASLPAASVAIVSVTVTALLHIWKKNNIISIVCGTALYMILIRLI